LVPSIKEQAVRMERSRWIQDYLEISWRVEGEVPDTDDVQIPVLEGDGK
jgi:hypothetical protein